VRLTVVGCAGSFPSPRSPASCYLVEADDAAGRTWRVLLDLGSGALGPLQRLVAPGGIDEILLSHLHPDHCMDLCGLFVALRYDPAGRPTRRIPVYGPGHTLSRLERAYGADAEGQMGGIYDVRKWTEGLAVDVGPLLVTPLRVNHPVEAYGLRVEYAGRVIAYTGDTDTCPALVRLGAAADLLLAEASFVEGRDLEPDIHLTGHRAGLVAASCEAKRLVLTHLPAWTEPDVVLAEAQASYAGPVEVATPGAVYEI